jgi:hypothetical protein
MGKKDFQKMFRAFSRRARDFFRGQSGLIKQTGSASDKKGIPQPSPFFSFMEQGRAGQRNAFFVFLVFGQI